MMQFVRLLFFAVIALSPLGLSAQSPVGSWKLSVPGQDGKMVPLKVDIADNGTYTLDFGADGAVDSKGKYTVDGDKMTIQDTEGSDCTGQGVYSLKIEGNTMTMTRVSDACANRGGPDGVIKMEKN